MSKDSRENKYCNDPFQPSRLKTREVFIGNIAIGANHPIRIQSMTNTLTSDTIASVRQCIRIIEKGADFVRLTAVNVREAENLANIKNELRNRGYSTPLIADVHFNPKVAETAAKIVEKIRINPGNFASSGENGILSIRKNLIPLIRICKNYGTAMRIGVNHGSLSNRILEKYGDTPEGMVESAIEYLQICQEEDFHQLVFSMKSSNTRVMVQSHRLFVSKMMQLGEIYPLHLGVTEAGEGEDGRIKSAVGIGTLLADGIGDTIRISLTEDPEEEIPVGQKLVAYFENKKAILKADPKIIYPIKPFQYKKRPSTESINIGGANVPVVISNLENNLNINWSDFGFTYIPNSKSWQKSDRSPDYLFFGSTVPLISLPEGTKGLLSAKVWQNLVEFQEKIFPVFTIEEYFVSEKKSNSLNFITIPANQELTPFIQELKKDQTIVLVLDGSGNTAFYDKRAIISRLIKENILVPVILKQTYNFDDPEKQILASASDLGGLFIDGLGDGIWIETNDCLPPEQSVSLAFGILQASRVRTSKTEFISCPSCGRTLFDIQEITAKIRQKTQHLKGLKIGVMGCIVNGPGEMADADYGYVGSGKGKISLYKNKDVIKKNIPTETAVEELIQLIKENGDWVNPANEK